ncbi:hypothetical protein BDZ89DRAFT_1137900 [Hymenopellis radicata]|nr:hypothetical protein BDZ89DRAFT_1137900 [Hymenopellis radicata]
MSDRSTSPSSTANQDADYEGENDTPSDNEYHYSLTSSSVSRDYDESSATERLAYPAGIDAWPARLRTLLFFDAPFLDVESTAAERLPSGNQSLTGEVANAAHLGRYRPMPMRCILIFAVLATINTPPPYSEERVPVWILLNRSVFSVCMHSQPDSNLTLLGINTPKTTFKREDDDLPFLENLHTLPLKKHRPSPFLAPFRASPPAGYYRSRPVCVQRQHYKCPVCDRVQENRWKSSQHARARPRNRPEEGWRSMGVRLEDLDLYN